MKQRTPLEEMNEHVELADYNALASDTEKQERLDSALDCALEILEGHLKETWVGIRGDLENERGSMYIYAQVDDTWYMLPLYAVEVEGEAGGYALCSFVPSVHLIYSHLAQVAPRRDLIACARGEAFVSLLVIFAVAPPVSMNMTRGEFIEACVQVVDNSESLDTLGPWGSGVQSMHYLTSGLAGRLEDEIEWTSQSIRTNTSDTGSEH